MYMKDLDWNLLKSFSFVAKEGSLSAAARALNTTQPTIGRHIDALELALGTPLFVRTREGLIPTEDALNLLPEAESMLGSYGALLRRVSGDNPEEMGTVRVAMSEIMGIEVIPELLTKFSLKYPGIKMEMSISNKMDNLLKRDADIAIRMTKPKQDALIAKKVGEIQIGLFAHKDYIAKNGKPRDIIDLKKHKIIGPDTDQLFLMALKSYGLDISRDDVHFRVDNQIAQTELMRKGAGICAMQLPLAKREKDFEALLPKKIKIPMPIWVVMHEDLKSSRRVRLMFDFLKESLADYIES